jgi:hypothetical protein
MSNKAKIHQITIILVKFLIGCYLLICDYLKALTWIGEIQETAEALAGGGIGTQHRLLSKKRAKHVVCPIQSVRYLLYTADIYHHC